MKKNILPVLASLILSIHLYGQSQSQYQILVERPGEKTFKGLITRESLTSDTSFHWYKEGLLGYNPDPQAQALLKRNRDSVEFVVFMGTWCEDSHFVIPKFYYLMDITAFPQERVTLIGVDRNKKTLAHLAEALGIENVPTIIVMKKGKELGRVVEYGKSGLFDQDMAEILSKEASH